MAFAPEKKENTNPLFAFFSFFAALRTIFFPVFRAIFSRCAFVFFPVVTGRLSAGFF